MFATGLERPYGLAFHGDFLYVGNNDAVVRFRYRPGALEAEGPPERLVDLPLSSDALDRDTAERLGIDISRTRGFNHWTRNLVFRPDGRKLYVAVGSATNAMPGTAITTTSVTPPRSRVGSSASPNPPQTRV